MYQEIENRMANELAWPTPQFPTFVKPPVYEQFEDYCEEEASLKEMIEMFIEHWHPLELHSFVTTGKYEYELVKYRVTYAEFLIKESGIDIDVQQALEILGELE